MKFALCILMMIAVYNLGAATARAEGPPMMISESGAWKSYSFIDNGEKVCFMSSHPKKQEGKFKKRGEVLFFVTRWSAEKDKNVVSVSGGYRFKPGSIVTATVDQNVFNLVPQGEMAWAKDQAMDDALTDALQKGKSLVVEGASEHGTRTKDSYALKGSTPAYQSVMKACAAKPSGKK